MYYIFDICTLFSFWIIKNKPLFLEVCRWSEASGAYVPEAVSFCPCDYDHEALDAFAPALADAPEGGERCLACFALRLNYTAFLAKQHGFEYFTTTLSVSPHKNADNVNRIGAEAGERHGVRYLFADFKKKNGYLRSLQLSKEYGLYRQDYCGCLYSKAR